MERAWLYAVSGPKVAADAIRRLDAVPAGRLVGCGVFCAGEDNSWYVYANTEDPTRDDIAFIEQTLDPLGTRTSMTLDDLLGTSLHLVLTGPTTLILSGLRALNANVAAY